MPATQAVIGYESIFYVGDSSSPIGYTALAEVKSIKPALMTVPAIDATHLLSPNATEEKLPGLIKPGTNEMMGNFIGDASQLNIATLAKARTVFPWKITSPIQSGTKTYTATGNGFFSKYETGPFEPSKLVEFAATIEITGEFIETVA
jgi:hypothetical protein